MFKILLWHRLIVKHAARVIVLAFILFGIPHLCEATDSSTAVHLQLPRLDQSAYSFLDRQETLGSIPLLSKTRPFLGLKHHPISVGTGSRDHHETERYLGQLRADMIGIGWPTSPAPHGAWSRIRTLLNLDESKAQWLYGDGYHLAGWQYNSTFAVTVQPVYGYEIINTDDHRGRITRFTSGARLEGGYARKLHFMVDFRDHTESGNGPYWRRDQLYEDRWPAVSLKGERSTSYDISESFIQYYGRDLSVALGRGRHRWGPARFGSLILNSDNPPFDYLRFDGIIRPGSNSRGINYTFLHGWLQSMIPSDSLYQIPTDPPRWRTLNADKFLSAQRLEIQPRANIMVGISQAVIYGDRGVQLGYLTPLNFLYSVQHSNDDKDNFLLGLDGTWRPWNGLKLYGELLFDDIVVGDLFRPTANNKSAYTVGLHGIYAHGVFSHFDASLEYTKIRPFVYSHFFTVNTYSHWASPLGYSNEPNSEFMTAEIRATFYPLQMSLTASRQNHGADAGNHVVGGSIGTPNFAENDSEFPFLDGDFQRTTRIGFRANIEILPDLSVFVSIENISQSRLNDRNETTCGFFWNL